mgnify:CR=1 FL=1
MEIGKAYRVKKYEHRFNPEMLQKVESAHSTIMLSQLSARMKVGQMGREGQAGQGGWAHGTAGPSPVAATDTAGLALGAVDVGSLLTHSSNCCSAAFERMLLNTFG